MKDDESFDYFYGKLNDIVNTFNLEEKMFDSKVMRKILRSLSEKFQPKFTATEESKNIDTLKLDELIGNLQTYDANHYKKKKSKSLALNTKTESMMWILILKLTMCYLQTLSNATRSTS